MTNRDIMLSCLNHEESKVPYWSMGFYNRATAQRLVPGMIYDSYYFIPQKGHYSFEPLVQAELDVIVAFNRSIDKCSVGVGRGANSNFGHGGPGEFCCRVCDVSENHFEVIYETGARHYYQIQPHNYHITHTPLQSLADIDKLVLPDANDPNRWDGFTQDVKRLKSIGEFTHGHINGFFSGLHYFLMDYQEVLMGFHLDQDLMKQLITSLARWNIDAARHMLDAGVDCITLCDDLGTNDSLLISPAIFNDFIKPWYIELNRLVHSYESRYCHLHSHGNINLLFSDLVEVGFDLINPLDPTDGMDIANIKEEFGSKVTLVGGMDRRFFNWDYITQREYLKRVISIGRKDGGFILMDSGGIPDTVTPDQWKCFAEISMDLRSHQVNICI